MTAQTVETLLQNQLAACVAATEDCLAHARTPRENDKYGELRQSELDYLAKLVKAAARLTAALAQLRGERHQTIHVRRSVETVGG